MIAGISGVLLFIFMFFGWYGAPDVVDEAVEQAQQAAEALGVDAPGVEEADTVDQRLGVLRLHGPDPAARRARLGRAGGDDALSAPRRACRSRAAP